MFIYEPQFMADSVLSVVKNLFRPGAWARATFVCRSSAVEPRGGMSMKGGRMTKIGEMPTKRYGTRMTRIGRIFTDTYYPCVSVSSVQSVFYRNPAIIDEYKKPQINADERRYIPITGFGEITHRKGRKERKAAQQESLCPGMKKSVTDAFSCSFMNEVHG